MLCLFTLFTGRRDLIDRLGLEHLVLPLAAHCAGKCYSLIHKFIQLLWPGNRGLVTRLLIRDCILTGHRALGEAPGHADLWRITRTLGRRGLGWILSVRDTA